MAQGVLFEKRPPITYLEPPYPPVHPIPEWAGPIRCREWCGWYPRRWIGAGEKPWLDPDAELDAEYRAIMGK